MENLLFVGFVDQNNCVSDSFGKSIRKTIKNKINDKNIFAFGVNPKRF